MSTCSLRHSALAFATWVIVAAKPVAAQTSEPQAQAAARALFNEARDLLKSGRYREACTKLEGAKGFYTSAGILLNLGDCYEKIGRTASAWTEFGEANTVAQRSNRQEEALEARRRQSLLDDRLSRLVIRVARGTHGLVVRRDGEELPKAAWGAAMPVDPGAHQVSAAAPGHESWTTSVTISDAGQSVAVDVPELDAVPEESDAKGAPEPPDGAKKRDPSPATRDSPGQKPRSTALDWTLIAGGAAVGIAGGALMLIEAGRAADARRDRDPAAYDSTKLPWTIGLVGAAIGGVSVATGVILLTGSGSTPSAAGAGSNRISVQVSGIW